jgi:hypothetical protein
MLMDIFVVSFLKIPKLDLGRSVICFLIVFRVFQKIL